MTPILHRPSRVTRRFMLMPLVDVIFLLLTFFMLSSQISPYAVLPVSAGASADEATRQPGPDGSKTQPVADLLVTVSPGAVQLNGENLPFAELSGRLAFLRQAANGSALVIPRQAATVQDVVAVLEILRRAEYVKVSIRTRSFL